MTATEIDRPTTPSDVAERSAGLRLESAGKRYGQQPVFTDLDLDVPNGSFTVLVGPSGCGKSTCLRVLAGLEELDAGRVWLGDADVTATPARSRGLAMVFQDFALYPNMTVEGNVSFGLRLQAKHDRRRGPRSAEIRERTREVLEQLSLHGVGQRRPWELSGGQRQRVALARAIVRRPRAFLMDEPLSNLDAQLRGETRAQLVKLHRALGTTFLFVTHDQVEAMSMATRLVVMDHGVIAQEGTPEDVYDRPATTFVARFIGSPPMNLVTVSSTATGAVEGAGVAGVLNATLPARTTLGWRAGQARRVGERPADGRGLVVTGQVDVVENLGDERLVTVATPGRGAVVALLAPEQVPRIGEAIELWVPPDRVHCFDLDTGARYSPSWHPGRSSLVPALGVRATV